MTSIARFFDAKSVSNVFSGGQAPSWVISVGEGDQLDQFLAGRQVAGVVVAERLLESSSEVAVKVVSNKTQDTPDF
jgi:hypothetical protein